MNIGIVGVPQVGKSTFYRLLTQTEPEASKGKATVGIARVPDARIDYLSAFYRPRKTTYAKINVTDIPGLEPGRSGEFLSALKDSDAMVVVLRAFEAQHVPTRFEDGINPYAELHEVINELTITDWAMADTRLSRLRKGAKQAQTAQDIALFTRIAEQLEQGVPLRRQSLTKEERLQLQGITFYSDLPLIVVVNTDEEELLSGQYPGKMDVAAWCEAEHAPYLEICAQVEMEIAELPEEDRQAFMQDLGITESGLARLARAAYAHLGLISFFTVGEDEVKAWTIRQGTTAKQAAGKIHSDIERGFIRAEVVSYHDFTAYGGQKLKEHAVLRLEGKEYVMQDGDIVNFRFNV
jgi:GTP-binding protein YchF